MYISSFSRINTVLYPEQYLSEIHIHGGDGDGVNTAEVTNTIRSDRASLDGVLLVRDDGDPEMIPGIHHLMKEICPSKLPLILMTTGSDPASLDDLIGSGYVSHVLFRFTDRPTYEQKECVRMMARTDATFSIGAVLDPNRLSSEDVVEIAGISEDCRGFMLMMPREPLPCFKKRDVNALSKALKRHAKGVRVVNDIRIDRGPGPLSGSGPCYSC